MSIITQALKKAQHDQRLQQTPQSQYSALAPWRPHAHRRRFLPQPPRRFSRRVVGFIAVGVGLLFGVGMVIYLGQSRHGPLPIAMTVPVASQPAPEAALPLPLLTSVPSPQGSSQLSPDALQDVAPPPHTDRTRDVTPLLSPPLTPVQPAVAESEISRAEQLDQAQPQRSRGTEAYHAGVLDTAEAALQQAIALDPTSKSALNRLGNLYYQRDAFQQALAMYQQALDLDPDYIEARNNLGNTYMQLDMSAQAIAELNKAIAVDHESGLTYYNMACVYARTGEADKAIRHLERAITHEPEARHWAKTDPDFIAVRSTSTFQKLLGTSP